MTDKRTKAIEWFKSQHLPKGNNTSEENEHITTILDMLEPTVLEADAKVAEMFLFGNPHNNGFISSLCYTVWNGCHTPPHQDGNFDWFSDTLPIVEEGKRIIREQMNIIIKGTKYD